MTRRHGYDQFLQELAVRLGDLPILVTDKPRYCLLSSVLFFFLTYNCTSLSFSQRVADICGIMQRAKSTRTLAVVYNINNIEKKDDFFQFFEVAIIIIHSSLHFFIPPSSILSLTFAQREVVIRFNCSKFENTIPQVTYHYSSETVAGVKFRVCFS
jgi:hypothetical protein